VRSNPAVSTVIAGARDAQQDSASAAAALAPRLSDVERIALDEIVPPGRGRKIWPA